MIRDHTAFLDDLADRRIYELVDEMLPARRIENNEIANLAHLK